MAVSTSTRLGAYASTPNTITVGGGGDYPTIQAAIDYIETQTAFTTLTMNANGTATAWTQGQDIITCGTPATTAPSSFVTPVPMQRIWFKLADDTYYYPIETVTGTSVGTQLISSSMNRIEASLGATKAFTWYKENRYTIRLLDDYFSETISIDANVFITFQGNGKTVWAGLIQQTANFISGGLAFVGVVFSAPGSGGAFDWANTNTIKLEFVRSEIASISDDFIYPTSKHGSIRIEQCSLEQQPTNTAGHYVAPGTVYGDVIINNIVWKVHNHSATGVSAISDAVLVDKCNSVRRVIIDGVCAIIDDRQNDFSEISVCGLHASNSLVSGNIHINNVSVYCPHTTTANFQIMRLSTNANGVTAFIDNCDIRAPNTSGTIKLVDATGNPAGACTVTLGRGNTLSICDAQANITYSSIAAQGSGTATVTAAATTVAVTHGLGYTPNTADIHVTPTLLSNSAKWWITAVGATTFTINVDVVPGAGTATFAWKIGI